MLHPRPLLGSLCLAQDLELVLWYMAHERRRILDAPRARTSHYQHFQLLSCRSFALTDTFSWARDSIVSPAWHRIA